MRLANIHILSCLLLGSVILSDCAKKNLEESQNKLNERKENNSSFIPEIVHGKDEEVQDRVDDDSDDPLEEELPILPPLILLDFNNDTIDANTTSEEKSKRTVNNGLGYGFEKNSLFSGKTNYYFPAGKTGTTVSIEESISPFLPKTIIEKYIPNNPNPNEPTAFVNLQTSQTNYVPSTKLQKVPNYYDTYDSNYRTRNERLQSSTPSSISSSTQRPQNHFDLKSSRYLLSNLNIPSYQGATNINTDINGQRGNIFRPTVQTYIERGQNVFQSAIPTKATSQIDDSQIFKEDYTDYHRSIGQANSNYFGLKQNHYRIIPSLSQSQNGNQAGNYNDVHSQTYNKDPRQSKTVSTTPNSLETNLQNYRYFQNIFKPNQQYYDGQEQHFQIASQVPLSSNIPHFSNNRNHYQSYVTEQRQNDQGIFTTPSPETNYEYFQNPTTQANLPRYTIENGVRYENKIFWKYPDGRISHEPPATYVETYTKDSTASPQTSKIHETYVETDPSTKYSVHGQGPIQFPIAPELPSQQSQFVSSESLSSNLSHQQAYRIGYQNLISQRPNVLLAQKAKMEYTASTTAAPLFVTTTSYSTTRRPIFSTKKKQDRNNLSLSYTTTARPVSKYMVNGPNAEYIDSTESTLKLKPANRDAVNKEKQQSYKNLNDYNNLQYSDLLSYNPSISQYIKDPSSILNVRPTFVQAGNSLVPVIILRVDGVPPVQPKTTSNINLKALLQEYLIQYAKSIKELAQPTNYELGVEQFSQTQRTIQAGNRLLQLARQTQNENIESSSPPTYLSHSYPGPKNYEENVFLAGEETRPIGKFGDRTNVRPKTKSVQIIEDQRFTNYNVKS